MQPFRKNLPSPLDGGGIKGVIVTKALSMVEKQLGYPLHERTGLRYRHIHRFDHRGRFGVGIGCEDAR